MLNQVIYTRCSPRRDLDKKGQVERSDGFGVFSMSQEIFSVPRPINFQFLIGRLAVKNGSSDTSKVGLIHSYEYLNLSPGIYAISYEFNRPLCTEPRKNGIKHRPGTYIKQCLVGEPEGYPFQWFGSPVWTAHQKSENDYYLDGDPNAVPPFLPQVAQTPTRGSVTVDKVRAFVADGRAEAVKAGLWFLLQEFSKPESERKVLLIKDVPENVELWIAAMEYGLSPQMARQITFATNRSRLGVQTEGMLFYYSDPRGTISPTVRAGMERRPYCMVVGFHPLDDYCKNLKQTAASKFGILDGTTRTVCFPVDETVKLPYFDAVVQYGDDINDFTSVVLPSLPIKGVSDRIPALFDAFMYLLDAGHKSDKWKYEEAVTHFRALTMEGIPTNATLSGWLLDESVLFYDRVAREDERKEYPLLRILWKLAQQTKREQELIQRICNRLKAGLSDLTRTGDELTGAWSLLNTQELAPIVAPALRRLFDRNDMKRYADQFAMAMPRCVSTVMDMYLTMLRASRISLASILNDPAQFDFVRMALVTLLNDGECLMSVLNKLAGSRDLLNALTVSVADYLERNAPNRLSRWWDAVMTVSGGNVVDLCRNLCASRSVPIEKIEQLLASRIHRQRRCDTATMNAFHNSLRTLGASSNAGCVLYRAWIEEAPPSEAGQIIRAARGGQLHPNAEREIFRVLDASLPLEEGVGADAAYAELQDWSRQVGEPSRKVLLRNFRRDLDAASKKRRVEEMIAVVSELAQYTIPASAPFLRSEYFRSVARMTAKCPDWELILRMLCLFDIRERILQEQCAETYLEQLFEENKGKGRLMEAMVNVTEAIMLQNCKIEGRSAAYVKGVQMNLQEAFSQILPNYYRNSMREELERFGDCEEVVKAALRMQLDEAARKAPAKSSRSFPWFPF